MEQTNDISLRIKGIIEALGMNNNSFAKSLGRSYSNVAYIIEGKVKPGFDFITALLKKYPQVNSSWLLTGEGEMFADAPALVAANENYLQEYLKKLEESFMRLSKQIEVKDQQIAAKDKQIDRLMDLLGKPSDVVEEAQELPLWGEIEARA